MNNVEIKRTNLIDCVEFKPKKFGDSRGYFKSLTKEQLKELGFNEFNQFSESMSSKGTLRGMHYQVDPYSQAKLVSCVQGRVLDVVIDCRKGSPTYGKYVAVELDPIIGNMLYVPRGFAHGFLSLEDNSKFQYFVDNEYRVDREGGVAWDDPKVDIPWFSYFKKYGIDQPILSVKDTNRNTLEEEPIKFSYKPKKYLVTGYKGQLGYDIVRELQARGEKDILAVDIDDMDITNRDEVMSVIKEYNPDVIFHCAAWTQVDNAEDNEEACRKVNVEGTKNLTDASIAVGAKMIYVSTDYVFDGTKEGTYSETDKVNPMSVYGKTKYEGEEEVRRNPNHFITRTSWVFGMNGKNFIKTMLNKAAEGKTNLSVVNDQIGSPTYTVDLAKTLVDMSFSDKYGTYHVNNEGYCSWAEFADYIFKSNNKKVVVTPVSTEEWHKIINRSEAYRPRNSKLSKDKLEANGFKRLPAWQDAVDRYSDELAESTKLADKRLNLTKKAPKF